MEMLLSTLRGLTEKKIMKLGKINMSWIQLLKIDKFGNSRATYLCVG